MVVGVAKHEVFRRLRPPAHLPRTPGGAGVTRLVRNPRPCAWIGCPRHARFAVELEDAAEHLCGPHAAELADDYRVSRLPDAPYDPPGPEVAVLQRSHSHT